MASDSEIVIGLELDTKGVKKGLKKAEGSSKKAGKKSGKNFSKGFSSGVGGLGKTLIGLGSAFVAAFAVKKVIDAAKIQEDAINSLNSALKISGKFTEDLSSSIQTFASDVQANSRFGDEIILQNAALIQSLGDLEEKGLKRATQAAVDMSAALGISLTAAATLVGKAAAGEVGSFSRYGVSIKKASTNAETLQNALTALEGKFGGAAKNQVDTFGGAYDQLSNTFGDVLEELGFLITKSPIVTKVIKFATTQLQALILKIKDFAGSGDNIKNLIIRVIDFGKAINDFVILPFIVIKDTLVIVFKSIRNGFQEVINFMVGAYLAYVKIINIGGIFDGLVTQLEDVKSTTGAVAEDMRKDLSGTLSSAYDTSFVEKSNAFLDNMKETVIAANEITAEVKPVEVIPSAEKMEEQKSFFESFVGSFKVGFADMAQTAAATSKAIVGAIKGSLVKGISGGIQKMAANIQAGKSIFDGFGDFVITLLADMAIKVGEITLASGIALSALGKLSSPGAQIAAGAALIAIGSVIKGTVGGGGSTPSPTSAGGAPGIPSISDGGVLTQQVQEEERLPDTNIAINIQGDILDSSESSLRIVDLINSAFDKTGAVISREAIA